MNDRFGRFSARLGDGQNGTSPRTQRRTPRPQTKVCASSTTFVSIRDDDDDTTTKWRRSARTTRRHSDRSSSDARSKQIESRKTSFNVEKLKNQHGSEQTKCDQRQNITLHHPIIPDRQSPTDGLSPNRHGDRSRSHNDKSVKKRIPKATSGPWTRARPNVHLGS